MITRTGLTGYACPELVEGVCAEASKMQSPKHAMKTPIRFRTILLTFYVSSRPARGRRPAF
jgi:hypothetical protein